MAIATPQTPRRPARSQRETNTPNSNRGQLRGQSREPWSDTKNAWAYTIAFLVLATGCALASNVVTWVGWAYIGLAAYLLYSLVLLRFAPQLFLLISPFIALHLTELLAGVSIESGSYMAEISVAGYATGAFMRLSAIYIAFFAVGLAVTQLVWPRILWRFKNAGVNWAAWAPQVALIFGGLVALCCAYMIFFGLQRGFPLFTGADRFAFLDRATPAYKAILQNRICIIPVLGSLFVVPRTRIASVVMLASILFVSILFAEKFTSLLTIACLYVMPIGLAHVANGGKIKLMWVAALGGVISIGTMIAVLNVYGAGENMERAQAQLAERANAQGELWFAADDIYLGKTSVDTAALAADVSTWMRAGDQDQTKVGVEFGQYYVMDKFAKDSFVRKRMKDGTGYVFAFYAYMLITMGLYGMLAVSTVISAVFTGIMLAFAWAVSRGRWLEALLYGRLMSSFYAMTTTGFFWNQFGIKSIVTLIAAIGIGILTTILMGKETTGGSRPQIKVRVRER